jgi:hypothetical protein
MSTDASELDDTSKAELALRAAGWERTVRGWRPGKRTSPIRCSTSAVRDEVLRITERRALGHLSLRYVH